MCTFDHFLRSHAITSCVIVLAYLMLCFRIILFNLRITTFNCHGIKISTDTIQQQLCKQFDIILLQETCIIF